MTNRTDVIGYATPLSVRPGERVTFRLSSKKMSSARARIARVRCAELRADGTAPKLIHVPSEMDGTISLSHQPIYPGSCAVIEGAGEPALAARFGSYIWPTRLKRAEMCLFSAGQPGTPGHWSVTINRDGCPELLIETADGQRRLVASDALLEREWVFIAAGIDATGLMTLDVLSQDTSAGRDRSSSVTANGPNVSLASDSIVLAARPSSGERSYEAFFDGKIDRPRLVARAVEAVKLREDVDSQTYDDEKLVAAWSFGDGVIASDKVSDTSGKGRHGLLRNAPARGMTGANWSGAADHFAHAPNEYGSIHFHHDDIDDCGWDETAGLSIPQKWTSGYYALELTSDDGAVSSTVPFFVSEECGKPRNSMVLIAPTATYMAYSNSAMRLDLFSCESMFESLLVLNQEDAYLQEHRELGLSNYDTHADGSGRINTSAARPILNMRPCSSGYYTMDTLLIDWLDEIGIGYDVITDYELHKYGAEILAPYRVVMTSSHPEYYSTAMLDAIEAYQEQGGRHMYMGANGFYWRVAFHPETMDRMELRRGMTGTRTWESDPGETALAYSGEPGGLWRSNGRPPQRLTGVGFDAMVFDRGGSYRRLPDGDLPEVAFVFDGIDRHEPIGSFGLRGGAAGHEIDRTDIRLGTPPGTYRLATADDMGFGALQTPEEFGVTHRGLDGAQNSQVRADLVLFETAHGGACFSTGSIAWGAALDHNDYQNNVARLTENVLRRFLDPTPLNAPGPKA